MLGGRPLQDISAELHGDDKSWSLRRLEFRAPGATRVSLSEAGAKSAAPDRFKAALSVESSDPEALLTWLQGRGDTAYRSQKPLRLRGDVTVAPEGFAIEAMKADIEGGTVEGRVVVSHRQAIHGSRVDVELKAERLDLDAATAFARSLAGPQGEWPDEGKLSLDIGRATSAGQELSPLLAKLAYSPAKLSLEQLKIGQLENVTLDGAGNFDRVNATGWFALNSSAASLSRLTSLIVPLSPALAARLNAMGTSPGPARLKLALDLTRNAGQPDRVQARATADLDRRSSRASPPSPQGRPLRPSRASICPRSGAATSGSSRNCRPSRAAPCLCCSASIARWRRATARRSSKAAQRAHGAGRCG